MKYGLTIMKLCIVSFLAGCLAPERDGPAFKDVQTSPPLTQSTVDYVVENDEPFARWVLATKKKCEKYGCLE